MIVPPSTLALMVRGLRQDLRQRRVHVVRALFLVMIFFSLLIAAEQATGAPGLDFFRANCYLNLAVITVAAIGYFPTCITEEKEEGMIGLLQMANVGPASMLLGKSVPRLAGAVLVVSAQFPFTWLAVTLGGVLPGQVVAAYVMTVAYLVLVWGLGLLLSVVNRSGGAAIGWSAVLLGAFHIVPLIVEQTAGGGSNLFVRASPFHQLETILTTGFPGGAMSFQAASNLVAGVAFAGAARVLFPLFVTPDSSDVPEPSLFARVGRARRGRLDRWLRPGRAWKLAVAWKDFHFIAGGKPAALIKTVIYGIGFAYLTIAHRTGWRMGLPLEREDAGPALLIVFLGILSVEPVLLFARVYHDEWRGKTLPGLALLPADIEVVAWEKALGGLVALLPAAGWLMLTPVALYGDFLPILGRVLSEPVAWWIVGQGILGTLLSAWFSVCYRWGGLLMTLIALVLLNACCCMPFFSGGPMVDIPVGTLVLLVMALPVLLALPGIIAERLTVLAQE